MKPLNFLSLIVALLAGMTGIAYATPVKFTTNAAFGTPGPYLVQNVNVYIDDAALPVCMTDATGDCTVSNIDLAEGLHKARYELMQSSGGPVIGSVTHYVNVQSTQLTVNIPTVRVRWFTDNGVGVSLNGHLFAGSASGGVVTANVLSGCYTLSYHKFYPEPPASWPTPLPGVPDSSLVGFDGICFGAKENYPPPMRGRRNGHESSARSGQRTVLRARGTAK